MQRRNSSDEPNDHHYDNVSVVIEVYVYQSIIMCGTGILLYVCTAAVWLGS